MTNYNVSPVFTEVIEVPFEDVLAYGEFYEHFSDLLRDRIDSAINGAVYDDLEETPSGFIPSDDERFVCPIDEILITAYSATGCPSPNVIEFTVQWEREFQYGTLTLVK